jgi:hypothetical protein
MREKPSFRESTIAFSASRAQRYTATRVGAKKLEAVVKTISLLQALLVNSPQPFSNH